MIYRQAMSKNTIDSIGKNLKQTNKLIVSKAKSHKRLELENELEKEKINKQAWKSSFVPSYFQSEWGKMFLENTTIGNNSNKENNNFMQRSENDFVPTNEQHQQYINSSSQAQKSLGDIQRTDSKIIKKYGLPPISSQESEMSSEKKGNFII